MKTILVAGGSGYFGSLLVEQLRSPDTTVRVLDLHDTDDRPTDVDIVLGDIRDAAVVDAAVDGCDQVVNCVAQVPLARDEILLRSVNVTGTALLLDACRRHQVGKVVHVSSSAVFGVPERNPVLPSDVPHPREAYGLAKLEAEWACLDAARSGLDVSIVRPRTILGHGRLGIFGILFDWIADGADPFVLGRGDNRYQFVHAEDLAEVCKLELDQAGPTVLNVGTDRFGTMREALEGVCRHAGTGSRVRSLPVGPTSLAMQLAAYARLAPFAPYHWIMYSKSMWFDIDHVTTRLGWTPTWSTDEMFAQSYDWFLAHRSIAESATASHHRRSAAQGALRVLKRMTQV